MEEINAGYVIKEKVTLVNSTYVLGHNPKAAAPYVTWEKIGANDYRFGNYFTSADAARTDLLRRASSLLSVSCCNQLADAIMTPEHRESIVKAAADQKVYEEAEYYVYRATENLGISYRTAKKITEDKEFRSTVVKLYEADSAIGDFGTLSHDIESVILNNLWQLVPEKTHDEIYDVIENKLDDVLKEGDYGSFIDVCVEQQLNQKGYKLVIWGEENDHDDKFYSVTVYTTNREGEADTQIIDTFSESESFDDLKITVLDVLNRFDEYLQTKEAGEKKPRLDDLIKDADDRKNGGPGSDGPGAPGGGMPGSAAPAIDDDAPAR